MYTQSSKLRKIPYPRERSWPAQRWYVE